MHLLSFVNYTLLLASATYASELNGACTGAGGAPGVCVSTSSCSKAGGKSITGACPNLAEDIKCCTKAACGTDGDCRWTDSCTGTPVANQCPGPAAFKCCQPGGDTGGEDGYPTPEYPAVGDATGSCKQVTVTSAEKVIEAFPGKVRELFCTRDCTCPGTSEHCCGRAMDFMCSDGGGVRTEAGEPIAEWVMENHASMNVMYVIWGQKIWSPSRDDQGPWSGWRDMEDRGSVTANHWDHVHVSYNE
ncbi:hypothetical protein P152DRAFT_449315 [Eremomyces bilateralis CBS 781.70]|uniref:ARB-07466-like C-terminal domain-containing protein n=1 Tax=Eremomyces bilateralis CBS 781.70 TaxID=1392243 RepID=A0A6G1G3V8_9PEZI|nr:uncharacterized protein P152DRAFT_449315 [Eremomyces bilateralis CBS 781.70]KAF1812600.1 hypothetical protein P152DRAFT_449315 [Eremomyces bilateralis CBS 781.70]